MSDPTFAAEQLELEYVDGRTWIVKREFTYRVSATLEVRVPAGFITDFASIPRLLWRVLPPAGDGPGRAYGKAAVLHDYLYQHAGYTVAGPSCSRGDADRVLLAAMTDLTVDERRRQVIFAGVRVGGWHSWNGYRDAEAAKART